MPIRIIHLICRFYAFNAKDLKRPRTTVLFVFNQYLDNALKVYR